MASTTYDHFTKTCKNGYPQYYGVTVDPVTGVETKHELNGSDWVAAGQAQGVESLSLGCPPNYIGNTSGLGVKGVQRIGPNVPPQQPLSKGVTSALTKKYGTRLGASPELIKAVQKIIPMRGFMLADIKNYNGSVSDPNNMFEVAAEYARIHPQHTSPPAGDRQVITAVPKSGAAGVVDAGLGIVGSIVNLISDSTNAANAQNFVNAFATQFKAYMDSDFADIRNTLNATSSNRGKWGGWGPKGALDMLLQFKNTSWKDLKNTINDYCTTHNIPVPQSVKSLWDDQQTLENELRAQLAQTNGQGAVNNGTSYSSQISGSAMTGGGGYSMPMVNFNFSKWLPWIIGIVVLIALIIGISIAMKAAKKRKSKTSKTS